MKKRLTFSHEYNARNNPKLQNVLSALGLEGIGLYWCLIEQLYEQGGKIPINQCNCIAFALHLDYNCIERIINDFGLFETDGQYFWSNKVLDTINQQVNLSEKRKSASQKRWQKDTVDANAMQLDCNCILEKERSKEKEDIYNNINNNISLQTNNNKEKKANKKKKVFTQSEQQFEDFRQHYPGIKRGFQIEFDNFKKKHPNWQDILPLLIPAVDRLIAYSERCRARGQFVAEYPHLQTWLNQSRWEIEYPEVTEQQQNPTNYGTSTLSDYDRRQEEFRQHIIDKLSSPDDDEPDLSDIL